MKLTVTRADIRKAEKVRRLGGDAARSCPIFQALHRERPELEDVSVSDSYVYYWRGNHVWFVDLPLSSQRFIEKFDNGKKVEPATFIIKGL